MDGTNFYTKMFDALIKEGDGWLAEKESSDYANLAVAQDTNRIANELVALNHWASRIANSLELLVGIQRSRR